MAMGPRKNRIVDPSTTPIPNYGRGAFFGLCATLASGIGWAIGIELSEEFNVAVMLVIGWFIGEAVKRGMGTVDRVGLGITLYGTPVGILIGTYLYLGTRIHDHGGTVTIQGITGEFWAALHNLPFVALYGGFALAACWLGVAVCKEGMPTPPDPTAGKDVEKMNVPPVKR
jgi:hypothetical protein